MMEYETALWVSRNGIAESQLLMGRWTPEFYGQKVKQYRDDWLAEVAARYSNTTCALYSARIKATSEQTRPG
ncbi:MAG: hypothetical protein KGL39_12335 [Patescibacteria group bacterium]|nr:hypothetical protein [Patescibacteria group bacterium]